VTKGVNGNRKSKSCIAGTPIVGSARRILHRAFYPVTTLQPRRYKLDL
jgi:hypothetical protein